MRRIQLYLEEDLDEAIQSEAVRTGRSKASLIRECVRSRYEGRGATSGSAAADPIDALIGSIDIEPADVDEVVYGEAFTAPNSPPSDGTSRKTERGGSARRGVTKP
jgi:hypothetical protein